MKLNIGKIIEVINYKYFDMIYTNDYYKHLFKLIADKGIFFNKKKKLFYTKKSGYYLITLVYRESSTLNPSKILIKSI